MSDVNKTQTGTVTLSNGVAEVRYKIQSPKLNKSARLTCVVNDPMNLRKDDVVDLSRLPSGRPIDDIPLVYTIDASKSGNVVTFTVKSNSTTNTVPVAITITEYRPGNPIGVIKTQAATVNMSNGIGTTTYTISQTQPSVDQKVEGKLTNTPAVRTEVTVPKYVAPPPAHSPWLNVQARPDWIRMAEGTRGTLAVTYTWGDMPPDFGGDLYLDLYGYDGRYKGRIALELAMSSMKRTSGTYTAQLSYDLSSLLPVPAQGGVPYIRAGMYTGELVYPDGTRLYSRTEYVRVAISTP